MDNTENTIRFERIKRFLAAQGWSYKLDANSRDGPATPIVFAKKGVEELEFQGETYFQALEKLKARIFQDDLIQICYLCGETLNGETDREHVPPRQFYATSIRKTHNPKLFTIKVHKTCNRKYQKDEDYFVHAIGFMTRESYSGNALWNDISQRVGDKESYKKLIGMVVDSSVERRGLILPPPGKVFHRFDGERVWNVIWKLTRGLFFKETGRFLPENTCKKCVSIGYANEPLPIEFSYVNSGPMGDYPWVFDYQFFEHPDFDGFYIWAMLFWDKLIAVLSFNEHGL